MTSAWDGGATEVLQGCLQFHGGGRLRRGLAGTRGLLVAEGRGGLRTAGTAAGGIAHAVAVGGEARQTAHYLQPHLGQVLGVAPGRPTGRATAPQVGGPAQGSDEVSP